MDQSSGGVLLREGPHRRSLRLSHSGISPWPRRTCLTQQRASEGNPPAREARREGGRKGGRESKGRGALTNAPPSPTFPYPPSTTSSTHNHQPPSPRSSIINSLPYNTLPSRHLASPDALNTGWGGVGGRGSGGTSTLQVCAVPLQTCRAGWGRREPRPATAWSSMQERGEIIKRHSCDVVMHQIIL